MFYSHSYPRFDCKLMQVFLYACSLFCLFYLIQVCFCGPIVIWQGQYLNHGALLLKALGGGIRVLWTLISFRYEGCKYPNRFFQFFSHILSLHSPFLSMPLINYVYYASTYIHAKWLAEARRGEYLSKNFFCFQNFS